MNLLELAQKRCSIRKYASSPVEDEKLARELAGQRAAEAKEKQFASYKKVTLDNLFRASKNTGMLCTRMVPIRTALHSRLRRPQPVVETFFGSERSYGHRCGNRHGTYQLSSR